MRRLIQRLCIAAVLTLAACGGDVGNEEPATLPATSVLPTSTQVTGSQPTSVPTGQPTPAATLSLVIWWPDQLVPPDAGVLDQQIRSFTNDQERPIDIEFRLKTTDGPGSIVSTLSSAHQVAQDALPDITLLHRADLLTASEDGLIMTLDEVMPDLSTDNMYDSALALGEIDNTDFGLAYMVNVLLTLYREEDITSPSTLWTFDDVLAYDVPWVFSAQREDGISRTFYLQYLSAGGSHLDENAAFTEGDRMALERTLSFYAQAIEQGTLDEAILSYNNRLAYIDALLRDSYSLATVTSDDYYLLTSENDNLRVAGLPTANGEPISQVNGWMWVVVTSDPNRQEVAVNFINWMMEAERHAELARAIAMLPSQQTVLGQLDDDIDIELMNALLDEAILPLPQGGGQLGRAMQNALIDVITGQATPEEAANAVIAQFGDDA